MYKEFYFLPTLGQDILAVANPCGSNCTSVADEHVSSREGSAALDTHFLRLAEACMSCSNQSLLSATFCVCPAQVK